MNVITLRSVLLLTLFLSLMIRHQAISASGEGSLDARFKIVVQHFLGQTKLELLNNPHKPNSLLSSLTYFLREGCNSPSVAMPFRWNLEPMAILGEVKKPGDRHTFWYFNQQWHEERLPRASAFAWWLWHSAADVVGLSDFSPSNYVLAVVDPKGCVVSNELDWSQLWRKQ